MTAALAAPPNRLRTGARAGGLRAGGPGLEARVVEATLSCIARHGLGKTTIDDVAREAGCSRATLYRYFGSRQDLVARAIDSEIVRVTDVIRAAGLAAATLEDAVVAVLGGAGRELAEHPALRFVADFEPELVLPHLTFAGGDHFLHEASTAIAPCFERFLGGVRAPRAAEWIARVGLGLWLSPTAPISLTDPHGLRTYVRTFVLPAIAPETAPSPVSASKG